MERGSAEIASNIIDRINKLEDIILKLETIRNKKIYSIIASDDNINIRIDLNDSIIANEVFSQEILEFYINTLNLELMEEESKLEKLN